MCFPVVKEINERIYSNYVSKSSSGDVSGSILISKYLIATQHLIMLLYIMGTATTDATDWLLVTISFVDNTYTCIRIVWLKKRNSLDINTQINLLVKLSINELVEFSAPLVFMFSFLAGFYGPNYAILGNIGNNMWHYQQVEDIEAFISKILKLYFADLVSLIVSAIILRLFCRINIFQALMIIENEFKFVMLIVLSVLITAVRYKYF